MHYRGADDTRSIIKMLRAKRGFRSDRALARAASLEQPTLARYLNGSTAELSVSNLQARAKALQVTLSELTGEVPLSSRETVNEVNAVLYLLDDTEVRQVLSVTKALFPAADASSGASKRRT